ncbi:CubicO group peptidase (beta-lactamase class C family) [Kibdelosporangium banguiense]|uniref:CubicO group peptidase (Beta-lactamase class C family) n=1 Tax=Kibdelosporangium banguiense TaxID=1365924 RepID=A0ABS4TPG7_9PSEU|nr:serine hydrolase domain-containing protein [Kibdelosporangium banguiense]MBP2326295.1 CubicO group peptidase (beta-lactamase class C family) [Kibdelosporangium banguiense]
MAEIHGMCDERFGAVREALAALLDKDDVGASVAVYVDDEPVVDIWGGYADAERTTPWERDTITNVWSSTKTMTALCALILADRGDLDLAAPVARYWPEFAAAGKQDVQVRHLLSHTAGLPTWDEAVTPVDLHDGPAAAARLAAQAPRWKPGTAAGYHAVTYGFLVAEVIRRVTGRSLDVFFAEEVAGPLGADFHIGLPAEEDYRFAPVIPPSSTLSAQNLPFTFNPPLEPSAGNSVAWRHTALAYAGGFGNARSVGAVQSVLACGGTVRGVRLLSKAGCERAAEEQYQGEDLVLGASMRYGMGYGLFGRSCGWGGMGGSLVMVDLDARMTVSYVMNRMLDQGRLGDDRGLGIVLAAYDGVKV